MPVDLEIKGLGDIFDGLVWEKMDLEQWIFKTSLCIFTLTNKTSCICSCNLGYLK